jgi:predicted ATP-grasp superfamily ATP-dependent carboligase
MRVILPPFIIYSIKIIAGLRFFVFLGIMMSSMYAIVLDGQLKSALATVRSLGRAGVSVIVGADKKTAMSLHSKYATDTFVYPSPYTAQEACVAHIIECAKKCIEKPVIYAYSDATYLTLYTYREALTPYVLLEFPENKSVEIAFDKSATYSLAKVSGIPTIPTHTPTTQEELQHVIDSSTYPVVIKTRRSVTWHNGVGVFGSASFVHSKHELILYAEKIFNQTNEMPLIQPIIFGEEYGVEMLVHNGCAYAQVVHHRIRSLSPTGGASVYKEILEDGELHQTLVSYTKILIQKLMWEGPIMVEFKVDADTRIVYVMEINGRFWGSLPLSIFAGVDIPLLYLRAVCKGVYPDGIVFPRAGIRSRHFLGDFLHLIRVLFKHDAMRSVLYPSRLYAVRTFLSVPKGVYNDVWSYSDMKPACMELIDILVKKIRRHGN